MTKNITKKLILSLAVTAGLLVAGMIAGSSKAFADDCEPNYGGGETCLEEDFDVEKLAKFEDESDDELRKKVTDVKKGDTVVFRIRVKNTGDTTANDMKMEDFLPDELKRVGGSGLTEYWGDFEPGETETFRIKVQVKDSEFDRDNFDKCVVNVAKAYEDGDKVGSSEASVCYGKGEITELPATGPTATVAMTLAGLGMVFGGILAAKKFAK